MIYTKEKRKELINKYIKAAAEAEKKGNNKQAQFFLAQAIEHEKQLKD